VPAFVDLNADLGEGADGDEGLLAVVTSASVACGGHAGDEGTMRATARLAARAGVTLGAHPSYPDRAGFGRRPMELSGDELRLTVGTQVDAMVRAAAAAGVRVSFVKPHGALYNRAAADADTALPVVAAVADAGMALLCPPASQLDRAARRAGVPCFAEVFADRAYLPDGSLAGRELPGAVIDDPDEVALRAVELAVHGRIRAIDGSVLPLAGDSLCVHGDSPGALSRAVAVRRALEAAGVTVRPFVGG
jgi:UPF0271 protein